MEGQSSYKMRLIFLSIDILTQWSHSPDVGRRRSSHSSGKHKYLGIQSSERLGPNSALFYVLSMGPADSGTIKCLHSTAYS